MVDDRFGYLSASVTKIESLKIMKLTTNAFNIS